MSVLAPPPMPLLPPASIFNRASIVSAHRTPGLLTLTRIPKSSRRVVPRPPRIQPVRPTTPINQQSTLATPPRTPDARGVPARPRTPPTPTPLPKQQQKLESQQQLLTAPSTPTTATPNTSGSPGRLARSRRVKHKNNPSLVLEMPPLPSLAVPVPSSKVVSDHHPVLSRSEPISARRLPRDTSLPLSDWDLPADPPSPIDTVFDFWAGPRGPPSAPLPSGRPKPRSRFSTDSVSDSETVKPSHRQHVRSPSLPVDGIFNMSLSDDQDVDSEMTLAALVEANKILYAGPRFNNSPHPKNLPGAAFF